MISLGVLLVGTILAAVFIRWYGQRLQSSWERSKAEYANGSNEKFDEDERTESDALSVTSRFRTWWDALFGRRQPSTTEPILPKRRRG